MPIRLRELEKVTEATMRQRPGRQMQALEQKHKQAIFIVENMLPFEYAYMRRDHQLGCKRIAIVDY